MYLKRFLSGIFTLLISTQAFAACEAEIEISATASKSFKSLDSSRRELRQEMQREENLVKSSNYSNAYRNSVLNDLIDLQKNRGRGDHFVVAINEFRICKVKYLLSLFDNNGALTQAQQSQNNNSNQPQSSESQQAQQIQQTMQQSQQHAQQNQKRADQVREGKRKTHEPENEAHQCIELDRNFAMFGGIKNKCSFKVSYAYCNLNPKKDSILANLANCETSPPSFNGVDVNRTTLEPIKNTGIVYYFACKSPSKPIDFEYVPGKGIAARCFTW